jgi:magnesium transporter
MRKELAVGLINGLVWGGVIGVVAYLLYGSWSLGVVMTAAMTLNLLLAALMGVLIPMTLARLGRDPAMGASVMITAMYQTVAGSSSSWGWRRSSCSEPSLA